MAAEAASVYQAPASTQMHGRVGYMHIGGDWELLDARVVVNRSRPLFSSKALLRLLHWLQLEWRILFKLTTFTLVAHHISLTSCSIISPRSLDSDVNKDFSPRTRTRTWVPRTRTRTRTLLSRTRTRTKI